MTNDAKEHDARYADFATRMLLALASEEASIAKYNAKFATPVLAQTTATIRPSK